MEKKKKKIPPEKPPHTYPVDRMRVGARSYCQQVKTSGLPSGNIEPRWRKKREEGEVRREVREVDQRKKVASRKGGPSSMMIRPAPEFKMHCSRLRRT